MIASDQQWQHEAIFIKKVNYSSVNIRLLWAVFLH
jgi:hypothetical protein